MLVIRRKYSEAQIMLYHIKNLRDEFLLKDESNYYGYFYHYPSEDYEYYNLKAKYINALLYFRMSRDNKKVISEEMLINVECLKRKESIKILFDVLEDIKDPEASFFIKYSVDLLENTDKEDLRWLALKSFKYLLSMIEGTTTIGNNFIALSVEFYIAMLHSDLEEKAQGLQDLQKVQEKIIGLNHPSTLETVNAIQKLFIRDEDKSTYLKNEVGKRESLLQFEKSDLNAKGISILKEMYAKKSSKDDYSINRNIPSSSRELLPGNKRKSLGTENIQAKRKKIDNQQVSSYFNDVNVDLSYQQDAIVNLSCI